MAETPEKDAVHGDHVLPTSFVSPSELHRYRPSRDPEREQDIVRYMEGQAPDETVENVELVRTEIVAGQKYDMWDVTTDKDRWWVIDNLTNLYPQKSLPSLDFAFSLHIGLMMRMASRPAGAQASDPSPFDEVFRRQEQAGSLFDRALEPADFQAVGVQLRECLLSLLSAVRRRVTLPEAGQQPKEGDFIAWYGQIIDVLCPGGSNKELRQYLKHTARDTWQLVGWLLHDRDANTTAASIAIHGCDTVVGHSVQILERHSRDFGESCPVCKSRDVRSHFDAFIGTDGEYYFTCGSCHWSNHPGYDGQTREAVDSRE